MYFNVLQVHILVLYAHQWFAQILRTLYLYDDATWVYVSKSRMISPTLARCPLLLLGMSHFASRKMFTECTFSRGVIVFDYKASAFRVCKNYARCTFSRRVIVFDYQASVFCIYKFFHKTYVVWMSHIIATQVCCHDM